MGISRPSFEISSKRCLTFSPARPPASFGSACRYQEPARSRKASRSGPCLVSAKSHQASPIAAGSWPDLAPRSSMIATAFNSASLPRASIGTPRSQSFFTKHRYRPAARFAAGSAGSFSMTARAWRYSCNDACCFFRASAFAANSLTNAICRDF